MSCDHRKGYQHIRLTEDQRQTFFGFEWQGYYLVYTTLPFSWKASCYIYHTLSRLAVSYGCSLGIPCLIYIDDSFNSALREQTLQVKEGAAQPLTTQRL